MSEFQFDASPWELYLETAKVGSLIPPTLLLTMLEGEDDEAVEDAFSIMGSRSLRLNLSAMPKPALLGQAASRLKEESDLIRNGFVLNDLADSDPLRLYLEEIASIPAFSDENILADQHCSGKRDNASALTNLGLSRVVELAKEYVGFGVLLLDLIQEGSIGLWQGIQSFQGGDYPSHRDYQIRNALDKAVFLQSRSSGIGQKLRQAMQDYKNADEKLLVEFGRNPSLEEIAEEIHMRLEEAQSIQKMLEDARLLQQAESLGKPEPEPQEEELAVEDTAYFQMRQRITDLLSQLEKLDAEILTLRFGLEKGLPLSPEDTGKKLGLSVAEVNKREAAALALLRSNQT